MDPLNPLFRFHLALHSLVSASRDDAAIDSFRKAVRPLPDFPWSHHWLWLALHDRHRYVEAAEEARSYFAAQGLREAADAFGRAHDDADYQKAVAFVAARLAADPRLADRAAWIAELYAAAGETDNALRWLDTAYRNGDPYLITLNAGMGWNSMRGDPRFKDLLQRMRFPRGAAERSSDVSQKT